MATYSFSRLLQSNAVPSLMEESSTRHALIQIDSNIAALNDEITKTRLILAEFETKRRLAVGEQANHLGVLSAIRRFPLEIIGEILWFALPKRFKKGGQFELLQLSTISRSWRNAAFSTHKLWAVLDINMDRYARYIESDIGTEEILMDGLCRWIERSGSLPLNISIQKYTKRDSGFFSLAIRRLPAKQRWKEIILREDKLSAFAVLFYGDHQMQPCQWDSLELLDVDITGSYDFLYFPEHPPISLQNATNLKRLKLQLPDSEHLSDKILHVPWTQLTELELIACIPVADYLTILKKCPNLEVYEVGLMDSLGPTLLAPLPSRLILPKIRRLGMWKCSTQQIDPFLLSLELPNVNELCIQGGDKDFRDLDGPYVTDTILKIIDFSKCEILKLNLQWIMDSDSDLYRLLSNINSLTELRITSAEIDGTLFDKLSCGHGLNDLEVLEVTAGVFGEVKFDPTRLAEFAGHCHSISKSTGKFKSVSLNYEGVLPDDNYERLEMEGIICNISRL